ncbi:PAS domain S-box protein [Daejeonella sp.]|uniref:sensor histidine kinase n=1 Tax=Daejeonella sp. TaxID=2805397 RepID=UPI0025C43B5D|nr:PAS domain S-box protein [Daejeonella sp.]
MNIQKLKEHSYFNTLSEKEYESLKNLDVQVHETGIAHSVILKNKHDDISFYEVQFIPEFNSNGEVEKVIINVNSSSQNAYEQQHYKALIADSTSENSNFTALATFNKKLELIDYFTSSGVEFHYFFSKPETLKNLNTWLSNQFNKTGENRLSLSESDTGIKNLSLTSLGLSKKNELLCIRIECADYNFLFDPVNNINSLEKNILDSIPADIVIMDVNQRYVFLNKSACPTESVRKWLIGKNDFEYCRYRDKPIHIAVKRRTTFNETILTGAPASLEERFETNDGDKHHLRIYQPLHDSNGQAKWVMGYGLDLTSIKSIESVLNKMTIAVQDAMDGIAVIDDKGQYVYVNEAHIKMFGYNNDLDFIGKKWHMLYEQNEIDYLENKIFPLVNKDGRWAGETIAKLKDGSPVYQEITLTSLADGGVICICRDKTEEKKQKQIADIAAIVADNTSSVIIITDPNLRIQWVNKAFSDVMEYSFEEVFGKDPTFLHGPETDSKAIKKIYKHLLDKKSVSAEILNYSKNGRKYWMQVNVSPFYNADGELVNFISVENDITQLKQAEDNIKNSLQKEKELNELKSQFVSIASHEIRTPLASIQSSSDLIRIFLENDQVPKDKVEKHIDKIESQITRLSTIMSNLLTVGRINLGKFDLHKNETDIENFVKNIINEYFAVTSDGRQVIFNVIGEKHKSHIDKVLMSQVLINLISNAIKYSIGKPNPEVILEYQSDNFTIEVKDKGIGIPAGQHKNIFNSFFRANNVENIQGTGLGLVIVKKFVEMHKGKISFTSTLGKGTSFKIKFPYQ